MLEMVARVKREMLKKRSDDLSIDKKSTISLHTAYLRSLCTAPKKTAIASRTELCGCKKLTARKFEIATGAASAHSLCKASYKAHSGATPRKKPVSAELTSLFASLLFLLLPFPSLLFLFLFLFSFFSSFPFSFFFLFSLFSSLSPSLLPPFLHRFPFPSIYPFALASETSNHARELIKRAARAKLSEQAV